MEPNGAKFTYLSTWTLRVNAAKDDGIMTMEADSQKSQHPGKKGRCFKAGASSLNPSTF